MDRRVLFAGIAVIFVCMLCCGGYVLFPLATQGNVEGQVVDTYVKRYDDKDIFHAVIRFDDGSEEVFQNKDAVVFTKFNSADLQQKLRKAQESGERCSFHVYGWRVPLTSGFRVIVDMSECKMPDG